MAATASTSLSFRLWAVIVIAVLPVLALTVLDYLGQRSQAISDAEHDSVRMLVAAQQEEDRTLHSVANVLSVMARSDNLRSLDSDDCDGLVQRLLSTFTDFHNLGAVLPDGRLFCSGLPGRAGISVADREWFKAALGGTGVTAGNYLVGRLSGKASITFGYPLRDEHGELRAVLFAALSLDWFDRLAASYRLPEGWEATLLSTSAQVLARHPAVGNGAGQPLAASQMEAFRRILALPRPVAEAKDLDGRGRLYGVRAVSLASEELLVAIGAPLWRTLAEIDRAFWAHVLVLVSVCLFSAVVAHYCIRSFIERWALGMQGVLARIARGEPGARVGRPTSVRELRAVEEGVDRMAADLERRNAELIRRDEELSRLSMAIEQSPESVVITDTDGRIEYVNDAFVRNTGYAREELIGGNPHILNTGRTPRATYEQLWATLARGEVWRGEFTNTRRDGSHYTESATIAPIKGADGRVTHYVAVKEDITLRRESEAMLHRLAYYDPLTELPNRALLRDRLQQALLSSAETGECAMLLLLDVDRFKQLNDTQGHGAGDRLLRAVARRLRHQLREEDTLARQGDDDFAVIVERLGSNQAEALVRAEAVARQIHAALSTPYEDLDDSGRPHYMTFSIGITLFQGRQWSLENLLKQVEVALYMAKEEGRDTIRFFSPQMQAQVQAHAAMEAGLRDALAAEALQLHFQPQVDEQGEVVGAEALVRWPLAEGGMVSPAQFIPVAEDTGLIVPLGNWVLDTASRQLAAWQAEPATRGLSVAVNVSARQFLQPDFVAQVLGCVERHALDPAGLKLELTESVILGDIDETIYRMAQLRALGVRFALDDFGTGYSSLSYLRRLPLDQLKIDQSFVRDMLSDAGSETIVLAILGMSRSLGLEVIA
ncbi:MAG TPA: EAL domain-containing protein, partial [Thauera sp.]|nr:EAL domain-containing protein [Thauera sp.]